MTDQAVRGRRRGEAQELDALTLELVEMLGSPDPGLRVDLAVAAVAGWVRHGVYGPSPLAALGALLCGGLSHGLGERATPSVLRRSASAGLLAEVVAATGARGGDGAGGARGGDGATVRAWRGDALRWARGERDLGGWAPQWGPVAVAARGGDLLRALAESPHLGTRELPALLEAVVGLLAAPGADALGHREEEHLAAAALAVLGRGAVTPDFLRRALEPAAAIAGARPGDPGWTARANTLGWLRALHPGLLRAAGEQRREAPPPPRGAPAAGDLLEVLAGVLRGYDTGR